MWQMKIIKMIYEDGGYDAEYDTSEHKPRPAIKLKQ